MNTEHIISLARKAGWGFSNSRDSDFVTAQLCFAELVAAEEREACAEICDALAVHPEYASEVTKLAALAIRARDKK
jgi:hypothetical protein